MAGKTRPSSSPLVASPMWTFSAYPTPRGGVLRAKSSTTQRSAAASDRRPEATLTSISFEPPFSTDHFKKDKPATPRQPKLISSSDKPLSQLTRPVRSAPSIPSVYSAYGSRSPRLSQPYSREHESSAHRQTNPHEYLRKGKCP